MDEPTTNAMLAAYLRGRSVPCPECGYDLRDSAGAHCPECGVRLELRVESAEPAAPLRRWARQLMRPEWRAYRVGLILLALATIAPLLLWTFAWAPLNLWHLRGLDALGWLALLTACSALMLIGWLWLERRLSTAPRMLQWLATGCCAAFAALVLTMLWVFSQ